MPPAQTDRPSIGRRPPPGACFQRATRSPLAALACAALLSAAPAHAEPSAADKATATALFKDGKALMDAGKYAEACPKLEDSQRLDPAGGTLLNLAVCHEKEGKTATAWAEFHEALGVARRDGRADREELARERIAALDPQLSRLTIVVPPEVAALGPTITRDGTELPRSAWGTALPFDPGKHRITVSATGRVPRALEAEVLPGGKTSSLTVPMLEPASAAPAPSPPPPSAAPPPAPPPPAAPAGEEGPRASSRRTAGLVAGAIGVVSLGVGSYFGLKAFSLRGDVDKQCPQNHCSSDEGKDTNDRAKAAADLSTATFALGLVGVGVGAYLFATAPSSSAPSSALRVSPSIGAGLAGVVAGGSF